MFIVWRVLFLESRGVELLIGKPFGGLRTFGRLSLCEALSLSKRQCHSLWKRLAILEDFNRLLPGILLAAVDLAEIKPFGRLRAFGTWR